MTTHADLIRNIGIMAHIDAGKTTLTERILFYTGVAPVLGEVDEGTATTDWMLQERERGITITAAAVRCSWAGHTLHLIDTPGHVDFSLEVERALRVLDGAVAVFAAPEGVQPQSEAVWAQADRHRVPRLAFVNKMDRPGADFWGCVEQLRDRLGANPVPVQLPWMDERGFRGVVDLIRRCLVVFEERDQGRHPVLGPVPPDLSAEVELHREQLINAVVEDEAAIERYLREGDLEPEAIVQGLRAATCAGRVVPVLCGAARRNRGVQPLLDAVVGLLPSPSDRGPIAAYAGGSPSERPVAIGAEAPLAALAFKLQVHRREGPLHFVRVYAGSLRVGDQVLNPRTGERAPISALYHVTADAVEPVGRCAAGEIVALAVPLVLRTGDTLSDPEHPIHLEPVQLPRPVAAVALEPVTTEDVGQLERALARLCAEDPSLSTRVDVLTGQLLLEGMGELHLELATERLRREYGVQARVGRPGVALLRTPTRVATGEGVFDRVIGGRGQYARLRVRISPGAAGQGMRVEDPWSQRVLSRELLAASRAGVEDALSRGLGGGVPVIDTVVEVTDGELREVDATPIAFQAAAIAAVEEALRGAALVTVEPVMQLELRVPDEHMGAVLGDLSSRRARVLEISTWGQRQVVQAEAPLAELFGYASALRSLSQGRAACAIQYSRHHPVGAPLSARPGRETC